MGDILVKCAFMACLGSILMYGAFARWGRSAFIRSARLFFEAAVALVLATAAVFLYLIVTHQFQYTYVFSYSSRDLPLPLLISTFYAGQEGSFMLWTLFTSLIGVFLLRNSARNGYEPYVMPAFSLILLSLLLMLIVKNPFLRVWESWPGEVAVGTVPADGRGLNPLLQNYWMVIHPQVLFSGFSAMGVPYAYAVAALLKKDYVHWIRPATPWLVFGSMVLGTGIMMGGFWAYETLGWGGYWGWDPVENSSLVPWLVSVAAIHTTLSQRKSGAFIKTNLILGMMTFLFVLYSTFLTRSGVLGDTSVHSFVDPGMTVYWLLVGTLVFFSGLGATLVFLRRKELPRPQVRHDFSSREFALFLGASALFCSAILVTAGTSAPLIADILQKPKSAVDISYYVTTNLPLGIAIGLLAGVGQLLWWNRSNLREFFSLLRWPAGLALLSTIAVMLGAGAHTFGVAVLVFAAAFALWANLQVGWRIVQGNPKYAGGAVAHVGLAVLILGFVASSAYDTKETLSLPQGEPKQSLGYTLTYLGHAQLPNDKYAFRVQVEKDGHHHVAAPVMFTAKNSENIMRTPDIINMVTRDFYLAPMSLEEGGGADTAGSAHVVLRNGESTTVRGLGVAFLGFDLPADQRDAMMQGRQARLGARLKVTLPNGRSTEIVPAKIVGDGVTRDDAARAGGRYEFTIARMFQDASSGGQFAVEVHLQDLEATQASNGRPPVLVVEASVKPYINLVWSGVIIVLVGFGITLFRRGIEAKLRAP